jgi:glycosyltransferase involved in cell wall biosynthesis
MPQSISAAPANGALIPPLPIETDIPQAPIFLGGITAYLEQIHPLFQRMPSWLFRILNNRKLLSAVSRFAVSIDPANLGPMTYSVLSGREGRQAIELDKLLDFMETQRPIDLVSITNTLLSSAAPAIKQRLKIPIVSAFQGEDSFLDAMPEPWRKKSWDKLAQNCESIDIILSPGKSSIEAMQSHIAIDPAKIRLVRPGLDMARYPCIQKSKSEIFTVAYLSAITPSKGLDILVKAMRTLSQAVNNPVKLQIAGRVLDARYWKETERKLISGKIAVKSVSKINCAFLVVAMHSCFLAEFQKQEAWPQWRPWLLDVLQ